MTNVSGGKRDFFVSFNKADRAWATWAAWTLEDAGYQVLFQDWDFKGNFVLKMHDAIKHSRRMTAVLSPDYLSSLFTAPEWAAVFKQDPTSARDLLVPIRVRECEPDGLLAQIVYLDLTVSTRDQARGLLLKRVSGERPKPDEEPPFPIPSASLPSAARMVKHEPRFPLADHDLPQPDRAFVGRTAELAALRKALTAGGRTAITQPHAITGLGGIGKTQLALHYAYAYLADYDLVRWLRAEEPAALAVDYAALAPTLGLDPAPPATRRPSSLPSATSSSARPTGCSSSTTLLDPPSCAPTCRRPARNTFLSPRASATGAGPRARSSSTCCRRRMP
jgi:TIR domain